MVHILYNYRRRVRHIVHSANSVSIKVNTTWHKTLSQSQQQTLLATSDFPRRSRGEVRPTSHKPHTQHRLRLLDLHKICTNSAQVGQPAQNLHKLGRLVQNLCKFVQKPASLCRFVQNLCRCLPACAEFVQGQASFCADGHAGANFQRVSAMFQSWFHV
jgi:hypothetical protein